MLFRSIGNNTNFTIIENTIIANPKFPKLLYKKFKKYPNVFAKKLIIYFSFLSYVTNIFHFNCYFKGSYPPFEKGLHLIILFVP